MGIRRGGKLPMKDLVKAADGSVEGLKQLLKQEWELPEDTRVAVYVHQVYSVFLKQLFNWELCEGLARHNSDTDVLTPALT